MRPRLARRFKASAFEGSLEGQVGFGGEGGGGASEMPTHITRNNAGRTFEAFSKCLLNPHSTT